MAAIVGGALLSASMEMLVKKVVSGEFLDLFRRTKLDVDLLEKLEITLLSLQSVLYDAEDKQIANPAVKKWLEKLQDAVFETDELFDELNTEALRCQVEADQVLKKFLDYFKRFNKKINSKLQKLFGRLEHLRNQNLGLKEAVSSSVWSVTPTSHFLGDETAIYGRDDDKKKLKEFLLSEDGCDSGNKIGVISIVGMGGLGKTTLAKLLYNDRNVKDKFEVRGWAHIPKDFDVVTITKTILKSVTSGTVIDTDLVKLEVQLQQNLSNKKFLLVLDDIWYGNYVGWNSLSDIFNFGQIGSKIIITTRDVRVALPKQKSLYVHHLRSLETKDSWSLLARHAFVETNYQQHPNLEITGREISKKCGGLPLAAVALGGILRTNLSQDHWNDVLNNSIWEHTYDEVQPALLLSYRFLPASLKGCFAYCSIFPKNSILVKKMVVQLWIAEGLVPRPEIEKSWEKVAEKYFDELVSRSLIRQRFLAHEENNFEMHDLINDLAMAVSFPYCIRLDEHKPGERVRHLSYDIVEYNSYNKLEKLHGLKGLRTILPTPLQASWWYDNSGTWKLFFDLLSKMTHLHVLSLSHYRNITELPNSIGNLTYLRYLNLSETWIKRLPSETCKLYNLQTLLLSRCKGLTELPKGIGKLVKLRHLDIKGTPLEEMPVQLSRLENLKTLSDFIVSSVKDVGLKIEDLGKFPHLRGSLSISHLENVIDSSQASQANLEMKKEIDKLELGWSYTAPSNSQIQVLERLRPSTNLKSLTISGFGGEKLSNWVGDPLFVNMVYLKITGCKKISVLPSLGQLCNLKQLFFNKMESVKSVGTVFYGSGSSSFQPFTSLETLIFEDMPEWEEWKLIGGTSIEFPSLINLSLNYCPKLKENIPGNLPKLETLSLENCPKLEGMTPNYLPSLVDLCLKRCPLLMESRHSITNPPSDVFSQLVICLNSLQKLTLYRIPSLTCFPIDGLPKTLRSLYIDYCENLEFFSYESFHNYSSLEDLQIHNSCNSMTSFTLGSLPVLKSLNIHGCKHLKSISIAEDASEPNLVFLRSIEVGYCDELDSVSLSGLPIPKLTRLHLWSCEKLNSLPESIKTLTSLQHMGINDLPNLQSFSIYDTPINLRKLSVGKVGGILWNKTWEHHTSLSELYLKGGDIVKELMKRQAPFLPTNLVSLAIADLEDIEGLDGKWLQHLTSLHELVILGAPKLKSLPEKGELPSSLIKLHIDGCPLLAAELLRKKGREWRKISHIPKKIYTDEFSFLFGFKLK
ncbi:putative disease resistance RPP13-like protein 1 [Vicia villosa]|uniref:putative disease resistance RPP13-like protein 1 n=1 Tax=Vicia villosa TaxID=3911 RepID=UPI00273CA454|nr:putative disease resistance RPP13-like protein 1 [Vicia villosa]XP_058721547.1 putative disease resistance RPP13-like protein 1 [Vicia villosa]XP_058721548.1 putative disease resistance RPP13-like protein 1 [Vicia villosa]XP_058721549.1 putative disease resistance RPP13-like protein 1 [Vicia villosa]XP_058721550.1 putative disease resistance RPP13-like protein 1 [Vicia villosa]XP_058721551.1 putative disease resistance RPP13-like protein 1 [Vicia villosa]XP_058721552.1 putative disease res